MWFMQNDFFSLAVVATIIVYSFQFKEIPSLKNRVFRLCLTCNLVSVCFHILFQLTKDLPVALDISFAYFAAVFYLGASLALPFLFACYTAAITFEQSHHRRWLLPLFSVPYWVLMFMLLTNYYTQLLYTIHPDGDITPGPLSWSMYAITYLYCALCLALVFIRRRHIDRITFAVLVIVPSSIMLFTGLWHWNAHKGFIGFSSALELLILYLYLQNKRLTVDELTGAFNRQAFLKMLLLDEEQESRYSILVVSLDDFKFINDCYGQTAGNEVLCKICTYLRELNPRNRVYRFSGDEFVLVLNNPQEENTRKYVDNIRDRFLHPWQIAKGSCILSCCIGVVRVPEHAVTWEEVLSTIDYTIAHAKQGGGNKVIYCDPQTLKKIKRKYVVTDALKSAMEYGHFVLHYQPIFDLEQNRFRTAEALLRIDDPKLGLLYPDEFIPIAEETGMIVEIGYRVLGEVCRFLRELMNQGHTYARIAVNLSSVQLQDPEFETRLTAIIRKYDISPRHLKLEITESVLVDSFERVKAVMEHLNGMGYVFALDDFGSGYSNMSYIIGLPLSAIKIDKSIIWKLSGDDRSSAFVSSMIRAFKDIGLIVVAEGIETLQQYELMEDLDCDALQGYYFTKPLPQEQAIRYLGKGPGTPENKEFAMSGFSDGF